MTNPEGFAVKVRVGGKMEGGGERAPGERKGTRPEKNYSFLSIFPNRRPLVTKPTSTPFYFFFPPSLFFAFMTDPLEFFVEFPALPGQKLYLGGQGSQFIAPRGALGLC